jgi:hypothetical protein
LVFNWVLSCLSKGSCLYLSIEKKKKKKEEEEEEEEEKFTDVRQSIPSFSIPYSLHE